MQSPLKQAELIVNSERFRHDAENDPLIIEPDTYGFGVFESEDTSPRPMVIVGFNKVGGGFQTVKYSLGDESSADAFFELMHDFEKTYRRELELWKLATNGR